METLERIHSLKKEQIDKKKGVSVITVENPQEGLLAAKDVLHKVVNNKTVLFLSGGETPRLLYQDLARDGVIEPGSVAMVDERLDISNLEMIRKTGFTDYLERRGIKFHPIIPLEYKNHLDGVWRGEQRIDSSKWFAKQYNTVVEGLLLGKEKEGIAIMGIGADGHTAGVAPDRPDFRNPIFNNPSYTYPHVTSFKDPKGMEEGGFGERITMSFLGLSQMKILLVLVFGEKKKEALRKMFEEGKSEEIPARFYTREGIAGRTILITDQTI